jgi:hypothetical protein
MPGWDGFKLQVRAVMESYPLDYDVLPRQLAIAYDMAMKVPPAGDLIVGNPVLAGNVAGMEAVFKSVFLQQAVSPEQLPLIQLLSLGFVTYWTGATISPLKIPAIAPVGATPPSLQNLSGLCTFPGTTAQIPPFVYKGEVNVDTFINNFITAADIHLRTVSGIYNVLALYGVPPTATTGPGIVNWLGYTTNASSIIASNQLAFDSAFLALGLGDRPDLLGNADAIVAAYNAQAGGDGSGGGGPLELSKTPITDEPMSFEQAAAQIILNNEGGYCCSAMVVGHPHNDPSSKHYRPTTRIPFIKDKRYHNSGETMFGLDRVAGDLENPKAHPKSYKDSRAFFKLLDDAKAFDLWEWNYIPPDPLRGQLLYHAARIMRVAFDRNMNNFVPNPQLRALVPTNGKLMYNFAYAAWNGSGWFEGFGERLTAVYEQGMKDPRDLAEYFTNLRVNNEGVIGNRIGGDAYSLIRQGGFKIASKLGIVPISTTAAWKASVDSILSRAQSGTTAV